MKKLLAGCVLVGAFALTASPASAQVCRSGWGSYWGCGGWGGGYYGVAAPYAYSGGWNGGYAGYGQTIIIIIPGGGGPYYGGVNTVGPYYGDGYYQRWWFADHFGVIAAAARMTAGRWSTIVWNIV